MLCHIYNMPVKVHPTPGVATSLGAAIAAGVGVGIFKDFAHAVDQQFERNYSPDPAQHAEYEKFYQVFKSIYPNIKPVYDKIAEL